MKFGGTQEIESPLDTTGSQNFNLVVKDIETQVIQTNYFKQNFAINNKTSSETAISFLRSAVKFTGE